MMTKNAKYGFFFNVVYSGLLIKTGFPVYHVNVAFPSNEFGQWFHVTAG